MSNNSLIPAIEEIKSLELMAKHAADSKYLEKIGGFSGILSIAMYARELNIPIMAAIFGGIRPVLGKIEIAPQMMNGMIRKAGHLLHTKQHTHESCTIYGKRKDTGEEMTVTFTVEDAKRAKIFKPGGAWETYPKNMVYKSALANLARWLFPDVIGMAYVEGEITEEDEVDKMEVEKTIEIPIKPSDEELQAQFKEKFKDIENMDFDLNDFVKSVIEKNPKKTTSENVMQQAIKHDEKFKKTYLEWVAEKMNVEEEKRSSQKMVSTELI